MGQHDTKKYVWVVIEYRGYEDKIIIGVFSMRKYADVLAIRTRKEKKYFCNTVIEKHEVQDG